MFIIRFMSGVIKTPDTLEKLSVLSKDAQYDLACACGTNEADRRRRSNDDKWLYPVTLPNGGSSVLFRTLISNVCVNDCRYCPLRNGQDCRRVTLNAEEVVSAFLNYLKKGKVFGLFLSSGVIGTPDNTMSRLISIAEILRKKEHFHGYIHLKIIPGASDAAVEQAVSLSSAVSLNIESAGESHFQRLSQTKDYMKDIIHPLKFISHLTGKERRYHRVKQTTQFIVGASDETDSELVRYMGGLYRKLDLSRIYFSAYQRGLGESDIPGEKMGGSNHELLMREHRLYQADWLIRKYGFSADEIPFETNGNLSLNMDPKEHWAALHPEQYPVDVNQADRKDLLRVPGLGPTTVVRILRERASGSRFHSVRDFGPPHARLTKAERYLKFS
ncbi:MAG: helix-hairpin-helix domain-containing protein [Lentisphaerae bacterium]|nr:helix-hairpin-helix domain-containing protein [Lentisphaerota bacterium]